MGVVAYYSRASGGRYHMFAISGMQRQYHKRLILSGASSVFLLLSYAGSPTLADLNPYDRGCELLESGNYAAAVQQFDQAINSDKSYPLVYLKRGEALEKMG